MKLSPRRLLAIVILTLPSPAAEANDRLPELPSKTVEELPSSVIEIVVPKLEDPSITYQKPLPWDLLPFKERTDKFHSLGTAFKIGENAWATAAHVLGLELPSLWTDLHVRDRSGATHRLDKILAYSNYRDVAVFSLKGGGPAGVPAIPAQEKITVGMAVFAVGNAQGEGISVRGGQVASLTPEPVDGKWNEIRFSAPASPGNSGGPLLDGAGQAVGIIVRRNETENLNYAVPWSEVRGISRSSAEFFVKNSSMQDGTRRVTRPWRFGFALPASSEQIRKAVIASAAAHGEALAKELRAEHGGHLFPKHPRFRDYLREQSKGGIFGKVERDQAEETWTVKQIDMGRKDVAANQRFYSGAFGDRTSAVIVEKPQDGPLQAFFDDPKRIMDLMLVNLGIFRKFGSDKIGITSLGRPSLLRRYSDELGRNWWSGRWDMHFINSSVGASCTPVPRGAACIMSYGPAAYYDASIIDRFRENVPEYVISYFGRVADWKEFLALGPGYVPKFFAGSSVDPEARGLRLGGLELGFPKDLGVTPSSFVIAAMGYRPDREREAEVLGVNVLPVLGLKRKFSVERLFEPEERASDDRRARWAQINRKAAPFDGSVASSDGLNIVNRIAPQTRQPAGDGGVGRVLVLSCVDEGGVPGAKLQESCGAVSLNWP